jgi:hypothetical protein
MPSFWEAEAVALNVPWKSKEAIASKGEKGSISPTDKKHWFKKAQPDETYWEKGCEGKACPKNSRCVDKQITKKTDQKIEQDDVGQEDLEMKMEMEIE